MGYLEQGDTKDEEN